MKPATLAIQEALQDALTLPELPKRIECFDISHIQGTDKVASMVVWEDGRMKKSDYRKFNIKSSDLTPGDDYGMMREVLQRRFKRLLSAAPAAKPPPPLSPLIPIRSGSSPSRPAFACSQTKTE